MVVASLILRHQMKKKHNDKRYVLSISRAHFRNILDICLKLLFLGICRAEKISLF